MISVVISTYNREEKLKRAIESVISQTFTDWELLVVDDSSTDRTKFVVKEYMKIHPNIKYFKIPHFGNDTKPKNEGILQSKGEYLAFLDDDNEYKPDHLMILSKEMGIQSADVLYGDRLMLSDDPDLEIDPDIGVASDYSPVRLFERNFIDTSDVLIKREALFMVGGFDERYEKYVDWNLWIRMCKANLTFRHIPKLITNYYFSKGMKSRRVKDEVGKIPFGDRMPERIFMPKWNPYELEIVLPYLKSQKDPKVAVFTLTMDRLEYTKKMYASLQKSGHPFDWFVVDNGSKDGTVEWLKTIPNIHLIENPVNTGISHASNQALDAIGNDYDFIIKIDNDCEIYSTDWLSRLLYIYEAHWQIILSPYVEGLIDNPGGVTRIAYKPLRKHLIGVTKHIGGIFTMAHKSAYKDFRWDENDFLHSLQDVEFTSEVQKNGFLCGYVEDMKCAHIRTTDGQKKDYPAYFEKRRYDKTHIYENTKQGKS